MMYWSEPATKVKCPVKSIVTVRKPDPEARARYQVRGVLWKQRIPSKATDCSHNPLDFKDSLVSKGILRFQGKMMHFLWIHGIHSESSEQ